MHEATVEIWSPTKARHFWSNIRPNHWCFQAYLRKLMRRVINHTANKRRRGGRWPSLSWGQFERVLSLSIHLSSVFLFEVSELWQRKGRGRGWWVVTMKKLQKRINTKWDSVVLQRLVLLCSFYYPKGQFSLREFRWIKGKFETRKLRNQNLFNNVLMIGWKWKVKRWRGCSITEVFVQRDIIFFRHSLGLFQTFFVS